MDNYVEQITDITAETERLNTELALGTRIQTSMMPNKFPAFPERTDFDIYAIMEPAKEVGGDFYDFFLIDEEHLGMVIADVSGKGIPAALFMMKASILARNYAHTGIGPSEILKAMNNEICQNNDEEMFLTAWIGILDLTNGKMTAANAGHEYPAVCLAGGKYEILKDKHGFVIGGMEGLSYTDYTIDLEPGSKLLVYTDGVPEAADTENNMFGMEGLIDALNVDTDRNPMEQITAVREAVNVHAGEAEQFDDITMMCLEYKG